MISHNKLKFSPVCCCVLIFCLLDRVCFILPPLSLVIWQTLPAEGKAPVKVTPVVILPIWGGFDELKSVEIDGGYIWTHYCGVVLSYPGQQGLQPPIKAFTW